MSMSSRELLDDDYYSPDDDLDYPNTNDDYYEEDDYSGDELVLPEKPTISKSQKKKQKQKSFKDNKVFVPFPDIKPVTPTESAYAEEPPEEEVHEPEPVEEVPTKPRFLPSVSFKPDVRQCLRMLFSDNIMKPVHTIYSTKLNQKYVEKKRDLQRFGTGWRSHMVDEKGSEILKVLCMENLSKQAQVDHLKRFSFASCIQDDMLFIHGGYSKQDKLVSRNMLIGYNIKTSSITAYKHFDSNPRCPGPMAGHAMIVLGNFIYLIGAEDDYETLKMFAIRYSNNVQKIKWGSCKHAVKHNTMPKPRKYFSLTACAWQGTTCFMFGGLLNDDRPTNELVCFHFSNYYNVNTSYMITKGFKPKPRYGHAAVFIDNKLYIHGGTDGKQVFGDLFVFNISNNTWTEIDALGCLAPPLSFHTMVSVSKQYLITYGGLTTMKQEPTDAMFRFDTHEQKWSMLRLMSSTDTQTTNNAFRMPKLSHHAMIVHKGTHALIVGGNTIDGNLFGRVAQLENIIDMGKEPMLSAYLLQKKREQFMCDLVLRARSITDGIDYVGQVHVHKSIVATRCPHLASLLDHESTEPVQYLDIEDTDLETLEAFVDFLYCGRIELQGKKLVKKFVKLAQQWPCDTYTEMVTSACSVRSKKTIYLSTAIDLLVQWFDLESMVDNENSYPDVQIVLGSDADTVVRAHKCILCRAPFFLNMFKNGFKEAETGVVEFDNMDRDALLIVLKFIYTDNITVTPSSCLGVLLYALLFDLVELQAYCRTMVTSMLSVHNVIQVIDIADLHADQLLRKMCLTFIKQNYEQVTETIDFMTLDKALKGEIEMSYFITKIAQIKKQRIRENNQIAKLKAAKQKK